MTYYAKSLLPNGKQPTVAEHCQNVANLAEYFGRDLGMKSAPFLSGLVHDFGKYGSKFQGVLSGTGVISITPWEEPVIFMLQRVCLRKELSKR